MVQLEIQVRRFVCLRRACSRKTFAEAIPALALRRARRTTRLADLLLKVGLALGGEAGSRLDRGVEHDHKASQAQQDKRQTLALYALHLCIASHTDHQVPPENETGQMLPIR
jgi:hypothetical protein